jgi:hypothetical protein
VICSGALAPPRLEMFRLLETDEVDDVVAMGGFLLVR